MELWPCIIAACLLLLFQDVVSRIEDSLSIKKKDRPHYHISAPVGWLNIPNGIVFFKDQFHVFYQFMPRKKSWGPPHWGHVISDNLIEWTFYPPALVPLEFYDSNGCLSGSAVVHNSYLCLFYTGQLSTNNNTFQSQNVAISADGINFQKYLRNPIIRESPFGSSFFSHPKVWRVMNLWYMLVSTTKSQDAHLLLYTSPDLFLWKYNCTVARSYGDMGYLWESPDFFEADGFHVLILSARGIQSDGSRFKNLYQTGYVIGNFNYVYGKFEDLEVSSATFNELDHGHDFYAAKTMLSPDGRRLLIAWLGMWENEDEDYDTSWASTLTLIREVKLTPAGVLLMRPVREIIHLRTETLEDAWYSPSESFPTGSRSFELIVNSSSDKFNAAVFLEWGDGSQYTIAYDADAGFVSVDRGGIDGFRRADWKPSSHVHWHIFVDYTSIEVFCGDGEVVFSSRIKIKKGMRVRIGGDTHLHVIQYRLRRSITYDFKLRKRVLKKKYRDYS